MVDAESILTTVPSYLHGSILHFHRWTNSFGSLTTYDIGTNCSSPVLQMNKLSFPRLGLRKRVELTRTSMQVDLRSVKCYDLQGRKTTLRLLQDACFWHLTHHSLVHAGWSSPWFQGRQSGRRQCRDSIGESMPRGLGPALSASAVKYFYFLIHQFHPLFLGFLIFTANFSNFTYPSRPFPICWPTYASIQESCVAKYIADVEMTCLWLLIFVFHELGVSWMCVWSHTHTNTYTHTLRTWCNKIASIGRYPEKDPGPPGWDADQIHFRTCRSVI